MRSSENLTIMHGVKGFMNGSNTTFWNDLFRYITFWIGWNNSAGDDSLGLTCQGIRRGVFYTIESFFRVLEDVQQVLWDTFVRNDLTIGQQELGSEFGTKNVLNSNRRELEFPDKLKMKVIGYMTSSGYD